MIVTDEIIDRGITAVAAMMGREIPLRDRVKNVLEAALSLAPQVKVKPPSKIDVLREWFGGDRYARDYEYIDANFSEQAQRVADYTARTMSALEGNGHE
jgi:hypothetical protein